MSKTVNCNYFNSNKCNSCQLIASPLEDIKNQKMELLRKIFNSAESEGPTINDFVTLEEPFHSRAKAKFSVGGTYDRPIIGLTNKALQTTELEQCPLHFKFINSILPTIKDLIKKYKIKPYQIKSKKGDLKGLIIKSNGEENQLSIRFISKSNAHLDQFKEITKELQRKYNLIKTVSINIQPIPHQILEGEEEIILTSRKTISEKHQDKHLIYGPNSFSQVTPEIAQKLYQTVSQIIADNKCKGIIDLFCGVGGFSIIASDSIKWGVGVEISRQAISYAKQAAEENCIDNLSFISDDVENYLNYYRGRHPDAIICNPPRRGLNENIGKKLKKIAPELILYSSCSPTTLQKDTDYLSDLYTIEEITPFDMFPLTKHMEVLAVLRKKNL